MLFNDPVFHGDNTGSNPVRNVNKESNICIELRQIFEGAKSYILVSFLHPRVWPLRRSDNSLFVCGHRHRKEQGQHNSLCGVFGWGNCLCVDVHGRTQGRMPHQFLHHLELSSDTPKQRRVGVSERMPAGALLNFESLCNRPDVLAENARSPNTDCAFCVIGLQISSRHCQ
jgi:hypothetical protein